MGGELAGEDLKRKAGIDQPERRTKRQQHVPIEMRRKKNRGGDGDGAVGVDERVPRDTREPRQPFAALVTVGGSETDLQSS